MCSQKECPTKFETRWLQEIPFSKELTDNYCALELLFESKICNNNNNNNNMFQSICEDFQIIFDRASKTPESSEELVDLMAFIEKARNIDIVKMNERVKKFSERMRFLLDVYFFPPEDIEQNNRVILWPADISPMFDQSEEVC